MNAFFERLVSRIFIHIFDRVWAMVTKQVDRQIVRSKIYAKHDKLKNEMIEELMQANTKGERDAILEKIYSSRPRFE